MNPFYRPITDQQAAPTPHSRPCILCRHAAHEDVLNAYCLKYRHPVDGHPLPCVHARSDALKWREPVEPDQDNITGTWTNLCGYSGHGWESK